jgi:adenylate kinase family enzyme
VAITGPRTAGKSTMAADLVEAAGGTPIDLDDPAVKQLGWSDTVVELSHYRTADGVEVDLVLWTG